MLSEWSVVLRGRAGSGELLVVASFTGVVLPSPELIRRSPSFMPHLCPASWPSPPEFPGTDQGSLSPGGK